MKRSEENRAQYPCYSVISTTTRQIKSATRDWVIHQAKLDE